MIEGIIKGQELRIITPTIVSDTINYLTARFRFSDDWNGAEKWAHFEQGSSNFEVKLENDEITADKGLNLTHGKWAVYVHGNRFAGGQVTERITTEVKEICVKKTGITDGDPFPDVEASEVERINAELEAVKAGKMEYYILTFDGTAFRHDGAALTFAQIREKCLDTKNFVYAQYENRLYIPAYVSGSNIFFDSAFIQSDVCKMNRISISSSNTVTRVDKVLATNEVYTQIAAVQETVATMRSEVDVLKQDLLHLESLIGQGGSGLSDAIKQAWRGHLTEIAYASQTHPYTDTLYALLGESDNPVVPPSEDATLTGIDVVWKSESADAGTNPSTLIEFVNAIYSDGSQQEVTDYIVIPSALAEGDNNVIVTYEGKTASKLIIGNAFDTSPVIIRAGDGQTANKLYASEDDSLSATIKTASRKLSCTKMYPIPSELIGGSGEIKITYLIDNTSGVTGITGSNKIWSWGDSQTPIGSISVTLNAETSKSFNNPNAVGLSFALVTDDISRSYAYYTTTGEVIFAGSDSKYYGMHNISEYVGE